MLGNCATCKWWKEPEEEWAYEDVRYDRNAEYEKIGEAHARACQNPKLLFYERPAKNGACVVDGSQYMAKLLTGPDFGCVNHEG